LLEVFQTSPAHPSDRISVKIKTLTVVKVATWDKDRGIWFMVN